MKLINYSLVEFQLEQLVNISGPFCTLKTIEGAAFILQTCFKGSF